MNRRRCRGVRVRHDRSDPGTLIGRCDELALWVCRRSASHDPSGVTCRGWALRSVPARHNRSAPDSLAPRWKKLAVIGSTDRDESRSTRFACSPDRGRHFRRQRHHPRHQRCLLALTHPRTPVIIGGESPDRHQTPPRQPPTSSARLVRRRDLANNRRHRPEPNRNASPKQGDAHDKPSVSGHTHLTNPANTTPSRSRNTPSGN